MMYQAYNVKFGFVLKSGWDGHWDYSDYAHKVTDHESPVIQVNYVQGSVKTFEYEVVNSNNERRTRPITKTGKFGPTAFSGNRARRGYIYRIRGRRLGGGFFEESTSYGDWNPDSY